MFDQQGNPINNDGTLKDTTSAPIIDRTGKKGDVEPLVSPITQGDQQNGLYREYHENGKLALIGYFKDGKKEGLFEWYEENGMPIERGEYKNGKLHGRFAKYYQDGSIMMQATYKDGKLDGEFEFHDDFSDTYAVYKNGKKVKSKTSNSDVRFRKGSELDQVNERFNRELQQQIEGTLPKGHIYKMGMPSKILLSAGVPNMPIEMSSTNLAEHSKKTRHPFELKDVEGLVEALQRPIAIFSYGDKSKAQNIIVEIQKEGRNFLIGIHFNQNRNGIEVSSIRGIFPKDSAEWLNWISQGKLLYVNKEKIQTLIDQQRKNLADVEYLDLDSVAKVVKDFENKEVRFRKKEFNRAVLSEQVRRSLEEQHYDRYVREQTKKLLGYDNKSKDVNLWLSYRLIRLSNVRKRGWQSII